MVTKLADAEMTLAEFLDSKWTQRGARAAMVLLGFFVPIGGLAIGYMVNDSRAKAEIALQASDKMLDAVGDLTKNLGAVQGSLTDLQVDLSAVKLSSARTAGIVEQMQVQSRPAVFQWNTPPGPLADR